MANLTHEEVLKLAYLARLQLEDDEIKEFERELSQILDYVSQLKSADTKGLNTTNQVTGLTDVFRPDEAQSYGYEPAELLKNVPHKEGKEIKVKRMVG